MSALGHSNTQIRSQTPTRPSRVRWLHGCLEARDGRCWSNSEIQLTILQIGRRLQALGINNNGDLVAVCMARDEHWALILLTLFSCGVPWLSLDPDHPPGRLRQMLANAGVSYCLVDDIGAAAMHNAPCTIVHRDETLISSQDAASTKDQTSTDFLQAISDEQLAYVIHTSGSTGTPNAVEISRGALLSRLKSLQETLPLNPSDRMLQHSAVSFDVSIEEVFWPMYSGATLVMGHPRQHAATALRNTLDIARITVIDVVPAVLQRLLSVDKSAPIWLRMVLCGGEALTSDLLNTCHRQWPRCQLINVYGPAETTINASYWWTKPLSNDQAPPIGQPFSGTTFHVLDDQMHAVPIGSIGELFIGGTGLALGYRRQPQLTQRRFINVPGRGLLYRTGDRVRQLADRQYEFVGRIDTQIKLRGQRIELGEIEHVLQSCPLVQQVAVLLVESSSAHLVACVLPSLEQSKEQLPQLLSEHLRAYLPWHMVPHRWFLVEIMPLTANGKLDRQALRAMIMAPASPNSGQSVIQSTSIHAFQYAACMARVLSLPQIDVDTDFFDAGGDSLLAFELVLLVQAELGHHITLPMLYQYPSARQLASIQELGMSGDTSGLVTLRRATSDSDTIHLFCLPPGDGGTSAYLPLAQALPNHIGVHAIPAWSTEISIDWPDNISDMVAQCLRAIDCVQTSGPLYVVGWSIGAVLAYEVARRWQERGSAIGAVVLLDPATPWQDRTANDGDALQPWRVVNAMLQLRIDVDANAFSQADEQEKLRLLVRSARERGLALDALNRVVLKKLVSNLGHLHQGLNCHIPKAGSALPLQILVPQCRAHDEYAPSFWQRMSSTSTIIESGVDHLSMMQRDYANELAQRVLAAMNRELASHYVPCEICTASTAATRFFASADHSSVAPGQTIHIAISGDQPGRYAFWLGPADDPHATLPISIDVVPQAEPEQQGWLGFAWQHTVAIRIPERWRPGLYRLADTHWNILLYFVVRAAQPGSFSKTLLHVPFFTAQAYNSTGGKSLYNYNSCAGRSHVVNLQRPDAHPWSAQHFFDGLGHELDIEVCASMDLHQQPHLLDAYDCLILVGHDEYWTANMRAQIQRFVRNGGNVVVLSGNTGYRQVRIEGSNQLVFVGHSFDDSDPPNLEKSIAFDAAQIAAPVNSFLGSGWRFGAAGGDAAYPDSYQVHHPDHWVFAGTESIAPPAFMHYETDAAAFRLDDVGVPIATGEDGTPSTCTILASAILAHWRDKPGYATMTLLQQGGTVFHAGTTEWVQHLHHPWVKRITHNVLQRLKRRATPEWQPLLAHDPARHWLPRTPLQTISNGLSLKVVEGQTYWCWLDQQRMMEANVHDLEAEQRWQPLPIKPLIDVVAITADSQYIYAIDKVGTLWVSDGLFIMESKSWIALAAPALPQVQSLAVRDGLLCALTTTGMWILNLLLPIRRRSP